MTVSKASRAPARTQRARTQRVELRLRADELAVLRAAAQAARLDLGAWMRSTLLRNAEASSAEKETAK